MMSNTSTEIKRQVFVPESGKPCERFTEERSVGTLTGEEAKQFYENVLKISKKNIIQKNCVNSSKVPQVFLQRVDSKNRIFKKSDLFRLAQNDDIDNLELFFEQNRHFDINITDDFHWTPLMCASCSGAERAVNFLLKNGADPYIPDKLGNTPLKLAKAKKFEKIVRLLENKTALDCDVIKPINECVEPFYCSTCNNTFAIEKSQHDSSTLHLFNSKYEPPTTYGIPESNKGFQLLLKGGWNKKTGLGPEGKGIKFPIQAKVKKNRAGLGVPNISSTKEPAHKIKCQNKKLNTYNKLKEKNMEKNFRREFL